MTWYSLIMTEKALTVKELIALLQTMDPDAEVWEEREGEHRRVYRNNIGCHTGNTLYDSDEGEVIEVSGPVVIFAAWD